MQLLFFGQRIEIELTNMVDKSDQITFGYLELHIAAFHLTEIEDLLQESLESVHIDLHHIVLPELPFVGLLQVIDKTRHDGQRGQQFMGNVGKIAQLRLGELFRFFFVNAGIFKLIAQPETIDGKTIQTKEQGKKNK